MTGEAAAGTTKDVDWRGIDIAPVAEAAWRVARAERSARFHPQAGGPPPPQVPTPPPPAQYILTRRTALTT